ncbi:MAG: hypothetical protein QXY18_04285 [Nitrososphaerota archaeon]
MGSTIIDVKIRCEREVEVKGLIDTGFYGDIMVNDELAKRLGVEQKYKRVRVLPNGEKVEVKYGGCQINLMGIVTHGDVEVWENLKLPPNVDALIGVTALEKLGFKVNPKTGELEKIELYLL